MEKKIIFGVWEAVTVLINMVCVKIFLNFPRKIEEDAGTAGWILTLYVAAITFLLFFVISKLYSRFEGKDLMDLGEHIGGTVGRTIVGLIVIAFLTYFTSVLLREFAENMKIISLAVSPISYVTLFFLAGMIVAAFFGLESIVRFHAIAVPIVASGFLLIIILVLPFAKFSNLTPVFGSGINDIFIKGIPKVSLFAEFILIFLMIPFVKTGKNFKKVGYTALGFSTFFLVIGSIVYSAVYVYDVGVENFLPIYSLTRLINYGRFFQRIESLFVLIWAAGALLYLSAGFYFIAYTFMKTFKLQYYKPLILPFAVLIFTLSLLPQNLVQSLLLETKVLRTYGWLITFWFVILLLLIARFVKIKKIEKLP
jgi:spore germination protein (amino acid permease)